MLLWSPRWAGQLSQFTKNSLSIERWIKRSGNSKENMAWSAFLEMVMELTLKIKLADTISHRISRLANHLCIWFFFFLNLKLWNDEIEVFKGDCVQSCMMYGSETWPMKKEHESMLERTEMQMVGWMYGNSLREEKTSVELREAKKDLVESGWSCWNYVKSLVLVSVDDLCDHHAWKMKIVGDTCWYRFAWSSSGILPRMSGCKIVCACACVCVHTSRCVYSTPLLLKVKI